MKTATDRTTPPRLNDIGGFPAIHPVLFKLDNGIPVYRVSGGTQDVVKIEFIFKAGRLYQPSPLVASFTNNMLAEGSRNHSAFEIASILELNATMFDNETGFDNSYLHLFTLNKHLEKTLPVLEEIIKYPVFPEMEFRVLRQNRKQDFIVNSSKVVSIGKRKFRNLMFGADHPYGRELQVADFERLDIAGLPDFHRKRYSPEQCAVILSGKVTKETVDLLNRCFGAKWTDDVQRSDIPEKKAANDPVRKHFLEKKDAVQSAIFIGRPLFNRTHPDWHALVITNTILGGYFGSRLMQNIREKMGYTYGIYSSLVSMERGGYFFILSEVGSGQTAKAVDAIYGEMKKITCEPVSPDELNTVKNYLTGQFLRGMDGPFAQAEKFKILLESGLDDSYFTKYLETLSNISPGIIMDMAGKYLNPEDMYELIAGKNGV
ncbi:MAG: insulinase family protein [Bacteroidetes bacterium]|nr:insulinase family protein [Bacteroidota bacterium]